MYITIRNAFHTTEVTLRVPSLPATLSPYQVRRLQRELCGRKHCYCRLTNGGAWRGKESLRIRSDTDSEGNLTYTIEER